MGDGFKSLAEAAAKAGLKAGDNDGDAGSEESGTDEAHDVDADLEDAMVSMVPEYRKALKGTDDKALAHVLMSMFEVCGSMAPPDLD